MFRFGFSSFSELFFFKFQKSKFRPLTICEFAIVFIKKLYFHIYNMRDFKRNSGGERRPARFGGREDRPRGRFGGREDRPRGRFSSESSGRFGNRAEFRRDDGPTEMHKVVCDKCGKKCTVPFKPTSSKPVYCNDCYRKNDNSFSKPSFDSRGSSDELAKINQKLDKIIQALNIE